MTWAPGDPAETEVTHRVVVGVLTQGSRVLMCHRRADRTWYPDVWDFPGGHIEAGETPASALVRELREELGVDAQCDGVVLTRWVDPDLSEDITFLPVRRWTGAMTNLAPEEHDEIAWFTLDEAQSLELPDPRYLALLEDAFRLGHPDQASRTSRTEKPLPG